MKKFISVLLIAIMLLTFAAPAMAASKVTATGSVNLRSGPGLDYGKLGSVSKGTTLKYLGESHKDGRGVTWYKVSYNGNAAWISSRYSKKSGSGSSSGSSSSGNSSNTVTATGSVNLRSGPGLDYGKLGSVSEGTTLKYLGETSTDDRGVKWYKVSFNGNAAWISSRYSRKNGGSSSSGSSSGSANVQPDVPVYSPSSSATNRVVANAVVNVRTGAGGSFTRIAKVTPGSSMAYLGSKTSSSGELWYKISLNGNEAWVCARYCTLKNGSSSNASESANTSGSANASAGNASSGAEVVNPFVSTSPTAAPDLTNDAVPAATQKPLTAVSTAPADYTEVSEYYGTGLVEAAVVLGIGDYRKVETEVPNQYYDDALTIAGNDTVEYIGLRDTGYTVFGVCVGMDIESAKALLTAAGLELYDSAWVTMFRHPAPEGTAGVDGYDSSINLYTNQDNLVTELDWSTYTG